MDKDETKEVAEIEDVLSTATDPTELDEAETQADGRETATDTVGDVAGDTEVDDTPEGDTAETAEVEADDTEVEDVSDDEISELERKLAKMERKIELTKKLRERTKELLDLGEVLHNTDEPVATPEDMADEETAEEIPEISETEYVERPDADKDEED